VHIRLKTYGDIFTHRQLVALTTFSDLVQEARERVKRDALAAGLPDDGAALDDGGVGATAYAEMRWGVPRVWALIRLSGSYNSTPRSWEPTPDQAKSATFSRQALPMTWDYAESTPSASASGNFRVALELACALAKVIG
jgi:putative DNA methylase